MTATRVTTIWCDEPGCHLGHTAPGTAKAVRADAPHGWSWAWNALRYRWEDLCPLHSTPPQLVARTTTSLTAMETT